MNKIDKYSKVIDTRDLVKRLRYLEYDDIKLDNDELKELEELRIMESEISEWTNGETLINVDYWVEYVRKMLIDCGYLPKDLPSFIEINWEKTADNIKIDYSECNYNGKVYYYRDC